MRKNISLILAFVCAGLLVSACGGGPTGPSSNPPPVATTPTAPVISNIEYRHMPVGLGSPLGQLITGPVPAGAEIQVIMKASVNTDRTVNGTFKIFDPAGNLVVEKIFTNVAVSAQFNADVETGFVAKKAGEYRPEATISDSFGTATRESPKLMVVQ